MNNKPITPIHQSSLHGGIHKLYRFDNNYGASVIKHAASYGFAEGLWELAVITWQGNSYALDYDTPITNDVVGDLSLEEVEEILMQIIALTPMETLH